MILSPGQTGVMDRGYQAHDRFDQWQEEGKHFVCRIKAITRKKRVESNKINPESNIFYDAIVLLGTPGVNQTKKPLRLVGYTVDGTKYWVATSRFDLTAEQIALIYKLGVFSLLKQCPQVRFDALENIAGIREWVAVDFHVELGEFSGEQRIAGCIDYLGINLARMTFTIRQAEFELVTEHAAGVIKGAFGKQRTHELGFLLQFLLEAVVVGLLKVILLNFFAHRIASIS